MLKEFKAFALKGNVVDLAVGVIIGGAFNKIVASLVNDVLMPVIGVLIGGVNFADLKLVITPAVGETAEVAILYGAFFQSVIDFMIIALSVFFVVKVLTLHKKKQQEEQSAPPPPSREVDLLTEIRDALRSQSGK